MRPVAVNRFLYGVAGDGVAEGAAVNGVAGVIVTVSTCSRRAFW